MSRSAVVVVGAVGLVHLCVGVARTTPRPVPRARPASADPGDPVRRARRGRPRSSPTARRSGARRPGAPTRRPGRAPAPVSGWPGAAAPPAPRATRCRRSRRRATPVARSRSAGVRTSRQRTRPRTSSPRCASTSSTRSAYRSRSAGRVPVDAAGRVVHRRVDQHEPRLAAGRGQGGVGGGVHVDGRVGDGRGPAEQRVELGVVVGAGTRPGAPAGAPGARVEGEQQDEPRHATPAPGAAPPGPARPGCPPTGRAAAGRRARGASASDTTTSAGTARPSASRTPVTRAPGRGDRGDLGAQVHRDAERAAPVEQRVAEPAQAAADPPRPEALLDVRGHRQHRRGAPRVRARVRRVPVEPHAQPRVGQQLLAEPAQRPPRRDHPQVAQAGAEPGEVAGAQRPVQHRARRRGPTAGRTGREAPARPRRCRGRGRRRAPPGPRRGRTAGRRACRRRTGSRRPGRRARAPGRRARRWRRTGR